MKKKFSFVVSLKKRKNLETFGGIFRWMYYEVRRRWHWHSLALQCQVAVKRGEWTVEQSDRHQALTNEPPNSHYSISHHEPINSRLFVVSMNDITRKDFHFRDVNYRLTQFSCSTFWSIFIYIVITNYFEYFVISIFWLLLVWSYWWIGSTKWNDLFLCIYLWMRFYDNNMKNY